MPKRRSAVFVADTRQMHPIANVLSDERRANKTDRQFYRQLALPAVTISDLQRGEAPLTTCNHC
jgi:hypothetical protein